MKRIHDKGLSVRKEGDIIEIRMYSCYQDKNDYFRGKARINNDKELKRLLDDACSKGLRLPKNKNWW